MTHSPTSGAGLLRRLYPAGYRAAHGEEIVAVFAESVRRADRRTAVREWAVLAAHALRLRTWLSSRDPAGRVLAAAAPFLLAGGAALGVLHLLADLILPGAHYGFEPSWAADGVQGAPWVLALLCAALGRWTPARALVLVAVVAAQFRPEPAAMSSVHLVQLWALMGGLVLLAPPDAVDLSRRGRNRAVAAAIAVALPMCAVDALWIGYWGEGSLAVQFPPVQQLPLDALAAWPAVVMALAYALRLADPATGRLRAAGVALAALPWVAMTAAPLYRNTPLDAQELLGNAAVVLALLVVATAVGLLRRNRLAGAARPEAPDPLH
ncbi:hypothetical protein TR51_21015 [Kitasatospora griseola]|uniref:Uncharacterized protein n=1 Tax=Kitasatospora griseola TaxID=2064 RepID=A0A0D0PT35_KITGR|nr:hypothetical protein [Kitasatospora griseola]KIQ61763.1 hypothetical protein TR51_21015 [Kitasatospora griseola]